MIRGAMRHRTTIRPASWLCQSYRKLYVAVLVVSLGLFFLPAQWTGGLISFVQILVPFQHAATAAAGFLDADDTQTDSLPPVSGSEHAALLRERDALEHQVAAIASRLRQLESEVEILTATRLWDVGGRGIGPVGKLIPAQVVTKDLLAWRESRLVTVGSLQGIKPGAPVVSNYFSIDRGDDAATGQAGLLVRKGMSILLKETLIGVAERVGTHTTRVKLLSDPSVQMKVRIGRFDDGEFVLLEPFYWLRGRGGGVMQIGDVNLRDVEDGKIRVGDMVFSDPLSDTLPAALTIGRITRIDHDVESPLLSTLTVKSPIIFSQLRRVYVFDPDKG